MAKSKSQQLYRIAFHNRGKIYEIYARSVTQGSLLGFVEIAALVFGERSEVVVDPVEEKLADEFADVERFCVPMHAVIRIDEVRRRGTPKVTEAGDAGDKVMPFPVYTGGSGDKS